MWASRKPPSMGGDAPIFTPLFPAVWKGVVMAGALAVILDHEETSRMKLCSWQGRAERYKSLAPYSMNLPSQPVIVYFWSSFM